MNRERLLLELDDVLVRNAALFVESVPSASHLNDETPLDADYYIRHRIETIKRIRHTAKTDALALAVMIDESYDGARFWGHYTAEEMGHDLLFAEDLAKHGVTWEQIDATPPFEATRTLMTYLTEHIAALGSLPAVAYSLFVEWNSERYSGVAIDKARRTFGNHHVMRSAEHYEIDETQNHYGMVVDVAQAVMAARGYAPAVLIGLIDDIAALLRRYFVELHDATIGARVKAG